MFPFDILIGIQSNLCDLINSFNNSSTIWKKLLFVGFVFLNLFTFSLFISALLYGTVYFYNRPTIYHSIPINFRFNRGCIQRHKLYEKGKTDNFKNLYDDNCYPFSVINLRTPKELMIEEGIDYFVMLKLELPESERNLGMGMFMVKMIVSGSKYKEVSDETIRQWISWQAKEENHRDVKKKITSDVSVMMPFASSYIRQMKKFLLIPFYIFGLFRESHELQLVLFDSLNLKKHNLNWTAVLSIDDPGIEISSAQLEISAHFSGLRRVFYTWPLLSFIIGTSCVFFPLFTSLTCIFYFFIWKQFISSLFINDDVNRDDDDVITCNRLDSDNLNLTEDCKDDEEILNTDLLPHKSLISSRRSSTSSSSIEMISSLHQMASSVSKDTNLGDQHQTSSQTVQAAEPVDEEDQVVRRRPAAQDFLE